MIEDISTVITTIFHSLGIKSISNLITMLISCVHCLLEHCCSSVSNSLEHCPPTTLKLLLEHCCLFFPLCMKSTCHKNEKIQKCQPAVRDAAGDQLPSSSKGVSSCSPESLDMLVSRGVVPDSGLARPTKKISERKNSNTEKIANLSQINTCQCTTSTSSTSSSIKSHSVSQPTAWDAAGDWLPSSSKGVLPCSPESLAKPVPKVGVPDSGLTCKSTVLSLAHQISNSTLIKSQQVYIRFYPIRPIDSRPTRQTSHSQTSHSQLSHQTFVPPFCRVGLLSHPDKHSPLSTCDETWNASKQTQPTINL